MIHRPALVTALVLSLTPLLATAAAPAVATQTEGPSLKGGWHATEVIVFERPQVGPTSSGEQLLTDARRTLPAQLRSLEPAGTVGPVFYAAGPDAYQCYVTTPAQAAPAGQARASVPPAAFAKPLRPPEPKTVTKVADAASTADADPASPAGSPAPPPDPLAELQRALEEYEQDLEAQSLVWLAPTANTLSREARRLVEGGGYRVLLHRAWLQDMTARGAPPGILLQAGAGPAGEPLLEGVLQMGGSRGLRFATTLWYRDANTDPAPLPGTDAAPDAHDPSYFELREERRLGDGQLHYLDHPKLGVIVRTAPVTLPAELLDAWAALNPAAESAPGAAAPPPPSPPR